MASEKMSDFLILNHTKMSEFSPDMNTKMRELMIFSFLSQTSGYFPPFSQQKNQVQLQPGEIPCDWNYSLAYGFHYSKDPSPAVREFLCFVRQVAETEALHL